MQLNHEPSCAWAHCPRRPLLVKTPTAHVAQHIAARRSQLRSALQLTWQPPAPVPGRRHSTTARVLPRGQEDQVGLGYTPWQQPASRPGSLSSQHWWHHRLMSLPSRQSAGPLNTGGWPGRTREWQGKATACCAAHQPCPRVVVSPAAGGKCQTLHVYMCVCKCVQYLQACSMAKAERSLRCACASQELKCYEHAALIEACWSR
jgi:hypothetical protein